MSWPAPVRDRVPVNVTVPVVDPERAHRIVRDSGCRTAKVKVADSPLAEDAARLEAVRDALGPEGFIRIDVNGLWDVDTAVAGIRELDRAAGGLEYVEQPCASVEDLAIVRRPRASVPVAADESIRRAEDPYRVRDLEAADVAVLKVQPLGGVAACLRIAEDIGLPVVVSSALGARRRHRRRAGSPPRCPELHTRLRARHRRAAAPTTSRRSRCSRSTGTARRAA